MVVQIVYFQDDLCMFKSSSLLVNLYTNEKGFGLMKESITLLPSTNLVKQPNISVFVIFLNPVRLG